MMRLYRFYLVPTTWTLPSFFLVSLRRSLARHVPSSDVDQQPDGETILQAIEAQHGILSQRAKDIYAFAHLTFQEYYTAKYIVDNAHQGTIGPLMTHIAEDRWREVFLLTASLLDETGAFFSEMQKNICKLVNNDSTIIEIQNWVERKTENFSGSIALRGVYLSFALALELNFDFNQAFDLYLEQTGGSRNDIKPYYESLDIAIKRANEFTSMLDPELTNTTRDLLTQGRTVIQNLMNYLARILLDDIHDSRIKNDELPENIIGLEFSNYADDKSYLVLEYNFLLRNFNFENFL